MRCLDCKNLTCHSQKMAQKGYGNCALSTDWNYVSMVIDRDCAKFLEVTPEFAKMRADWGKKAA